MKRRNLFLACLLLFVLPLSAARVDTLMVKSPSMNKEVQVLVVTPDVALGKNAAACPVLYLLHGYGGHAKTWIQIKPNLPEIADEKGIILCVPTAKTVGTGTAPRIRRTDMKRLFLQS